MTLQCVKTTKPYVYGYAFQSSFSILLMLVSFENMKVPSLMITKTCVYSNGQRMTFGYSLWRSTSLCSHIFLVLRDHGLYMYVVYIWNWSSAHALGASVVWHHSLLLMNGFNKTEAAVFSCKLCFLRAFPFFSFNLKAIVFHAKTYHVFF